MQRLLYVSLANNTLSESPGGGAFTWPRLVQGEAVRVGLRFTEKVQDQTVEVDRTVETLRVSLGRDDARPTDGKIQFKVGGAAPVLGTNVTKLLPFNAGADEVKAAFDALTVLTAEQKPVLVDKVDGSWRLHLEDGSEVEISLASNRLTPVSFLRFRIEQIDGKTVHDLRLVQSPVAFTTAVAEVVPDAPTIERVTAGGTLGEVEWDEVQKLIVPAAFRASYHMKRNGKKSVLLSVEDGVEEVAEALKPLADEDGAFVVVDTTGSAHIKFTGESMGGIGHDLLEIEVVDAPPGDPTFTLNLDKAELGTLLNGVPAGQAAKLELCIHLKLQNPNDEEVIEPIILKQIVEVSRDLAWDGMAEAQNIDHLRPPLPKSYMPFTADQIAVGVLHHGPTLIGDGAETEFVIDHGIGSELVFPVIRENVAGGALLRHGTDYTFTIEDDEHVEITLLGDYADPPAAEDALAVGIVAFGQASQFNAHTHTIANVLLLQDFIDWATENITTLLALSGLGAVGADTPGVTTTLSEWTFPIVAEVFPVRVQPEGMTQLKAIKDLDVTKLKRPGGLLPAVHDTAAEELPQPLPSNPETADESKVYQNQTGGDVIIPGGLGRRSVTLKDDEYASLLVEEEKRVSWYQVYQLDDEKSSWYPKDFDRELWRFPVLEKQLRLSKKLTVQDAIEVAVLNSNTNAQWRIVIECASISQESSPGTPDINFEALTWSKILDQVIYLGPVAGVHKFGCVIKRTADDDIEASGLLYDATIEADSAPEEATFYLRARLVGFDTENNEADPRGVVALLSHRGGDGESPLLGKAVITSL